MKRQSKVAVLLSSILCVATFTATLSIMAKHKSNADDFGCIYCCTASGPSDCGVQGLYGPDQACYEYPGQGSCHPVLNQYSQFIGCACGS